MGKNKQRKPQRKICLACDRKHVNYLETFAVKHAITDYR